MLEIEGHRVIALRVNLVHGVPGRIQDKELPDAVGNQIRQRLGVKRMQGNGDRGFAGLSMKSPDDVDIGHVEGVAGDGHAMG